MSIEISFVCMTLFFLILMDSWMDLLLRQLSEATESWVSGTTFSQVSALPLLAMGLVQVIKAQFSSTV